MPDILNIYGPSAKFQLNTRNSKHVATCVYGSPAHFLPNTRNPKQVAICDYGPPARFSPNTRNFKQIVLCIYVPPSHFLSNTRNLKQSFNFPYIICKKKWTSYKNSPRKIKKNSNFNKIPPKSFQNANFLL